jgi:hypothetical protein
MAMRVAGKEDSKGNKAMALATWVTGKRTAMAIMREMARKTREEGKEEGNDKGSKSNGDGKEDGDGEQQ